MLLSRLHLLMAFVIKFTVSVMIQNATFDWFGRRMTSVACDNTGSQFIKLFSCLTQLSMEAILLFNVKMPTMVGIYKHDQWLTLMIEA